MIRAIRKSARNFVAILVLVALSAGVAIYVLHNERLRFPWQGSTFPLKAEFITAQAVTPGQGQTARISGVRIGDISQVDLHNGRAIVTMAIDPEYKGVIHKDATALLRPKTGLKDMFIEIDPGTRKAPVAPPGFTIPIQNTLPDVNPDQIYASLDADTRDYLKLLVNGAGEGLKGRGHDLRDLLARFEPTHRDLARFTTAVATRREALRRLIHNLNVVNTELAGRRTELTQLVDSSAAVFRAFASEQANISRAVGDLPGALRQTTTTLEKVRRFAEVLRPAAIHLTPVAPAINAANHAVQPFAREATPIIRTQIRPFVRQARPLIRALRPASQNLAKATPNLTSTFVVLNHLFNMLGYNKNGREPPTDSQRDEGYLFWLAWGDHDAAELFRPTDADGPLRPVALSNSCATVNATIANQPQLEFLEGLTSIITSSTLCPGETGGQLPAIPPIPGVPPLPSGTRSAGARAAKTRTAKAGAAKARTVSKTASTTRRKGR